MVPEKESVASFCCQMLCVLHLFFFFFFSSGLEGKAPTPERSPRHTHKFRAQCDYHRRVEPRQGASATPTAQSVLLPDLRVQEGGEQGYGDSRAPQRRWLRVHSRRVSSFSCCLIKCPNHRFPRSARLAVIDLKCLESPTSLHSGCG